MTSTSRPRYESSSTRGRFAFGVTSFAGVLLTIASIFEILQGIAALAKDSIFVQGADYVYEFDVTAWGWIHLVVGVIGVVTGVGILAGQRWARYLGIIVAFLGAIAGFAAMPYYPLWNIVVVAFWGLTIWALCTQLAND